MVSFYTPSGQFLVLFLDVVDFEGRDRNAVLKESALVGLDGGVSFRLEEELDASSRRRRRERASRRRGRPQSRAARRRVLPGHFSLVLRGGAYPLALARSPVRADDGVVPSSAEARENAEDR